jgi:hypothetical protein
MGKTSRNDNLILLIAGLLVVGVSAWLAATGNHAFSLGAAAAGGAIAIVSLRRLLARAS